MHRQSLFFSLLALVTLSFAAVIPRSAEVYEYEGDVNKGRYIVKLRDNAQQGVIVNLIEGLLDGIQNALVTFNPAFFNGLAGSSLLLSARVVSGSE